MPMAAACTNPLQNEWPMDEDMSQWEEVRDRVHERVATATAIKKAKVDGGMMRM